jgi:hypothetical protein
MSFNLIYVQKSSLGLVNLDKFNSVSWLIPLIMIPLSGIHCTGKTNLQEFFGIYILCQTQVVLVKSCLIPSHPIPSHTFLFMSSKLSYFLLKILNMITLVYRDKLIALTKWLHCLNRLLGRLTLKKAKLAFEMVEKLITLTEC